MNVWPLRFRKIEDGPLLFADEAGGFFAANEAFLQRYAEDRLTVSDKGFLEHSGHAFRDESDLSYTSFAYRWSQRHARPNELSYLVLVPTLRCNLACTYCQVARADQSASGFDWTQETLEAVLRFVDTLQCPSLKIEFQGGEPFLRLDLLDAVRTHVRNRFSSSTFVVCTNLQDLTADHWRFLEAEDTSVSTSLDGDAGHHQHQRTAITALTTQFFANLDYACDRLGRAKISALPTIDIENPPSPSALVDAYLRFGLRSVYLRPINYQGFARKAHRRSKQIGAWNAYHGAFIEHLVERNSRAGMSDLVEEYYFSHCLRRIFQAGLDGHVDLRNPSPVASDYLVIDHDGTFYPSDEARMLARIGEVDLSIGHVDTGLDHTRAALLNTNALNSCDPDCIHCPFQPYCGIDLVDDISRYGRIDLPRHGTWFCERQTAIFDRAFRMLYSQDPKVQHSVAGWLGIEDFSRELAPRLP